MHQSNTIMYVCCCRQTPPHLHVSPDHLLLQGVTLQGNVARLGDGHLEAKGRAGAGAGARWPAQAAGG